ncbi:unnamed protein product [Phaedon cochleariae]|uniref:Uncharacterized protein n=1 Tax=Phaedon cochleariae TaxID=80249 RepID=A0A9P0GV42_PHACE|nr:unnamed protein product [Phaedon cochleariae]
MTITLQDIVNEIRNLKADLNTKIDGVKEDISDLGSKLSNKVSELEARVNRIETDNAELKTRLLQAERKLKSRNLIFYGLRENENEDKRDLLKTVSAIISNELKVNFQSIEIIDLYRLGKKTIKPRPVLVALLSGFLRDDVNL